MREKSPSSADRRSRIHLRQDVVATYVAIRSYDCTHAVEQDLTVFQRIFNAHTCLGELCFVLSVFSKLASLTYSQAQRRGFRSTQLELHIVSCQHRLSKLHSFHVSAMCYMLSDFKWRSKRPRRLSNDPYERFSSTQYGASATNIFPRMFSRLLTRPLGALHYFSQSSMPMLLYPNFSHF